MSQSIDALEEAFRRSLAYRETLADRPVAAARGYREMCEAFAAPLPETGTDGRAVIRELAETGAPGLMGMGHPRFFGWVLGGSHPVGIAADWLASAWGQNTGYHSPTPTTAAVEAVAAGWLLDILDLPREASVGFVTGATVGNMVALAAARGQTLRDHGWDPDADGLFGAPEIHVFIGADAHASVFSALQYLGLGHNRVIRVATDGQGRMDARALAGEAAARTGPKIVIAQAGQINTGAFDPFPALVEIAGEHGAWLHVDAAFGLWARVSEPLRPLTAGIEGAQSWATDGHKWLQTPFDAGYAIVRDAEAHMRAMTTWSTYLPVFHSGDRVPSALVPELSRRARGLPTWALLKALGRDGVREMVERHCAVARRVAERLAERDDVRVLNDVVLNQVIVAFGAEDAPLAERDAWTQAVIDAAVASGRLFVGGARWRDAWVMRISVISSGAALKDADLAADAILAAWDAVR